MRIAYVMSQFPELHETFILREIVELRRQGMDLRLFSLKPCRDSIVHAEARALMVETRYAAFFFSRHVLAAQVRWLCRRPGRYLRMLAFLVARSWRSPQVLVKSLAIVPKAAYFAEVMQAAGVTHIHAHWASIPTTAALIASRLTEIPFSFSAHAYDIFLDRTLLEEKLRAARFAVTCSGFARQYLREHFDGLADRTVTVNYHGLDLGRYTPPPARPPGTPLILSVGRLTEQKGYRYLIAACRRLRGEGRAFRCWIVGAGPLRAALERQVRRAGLQGVVAFLGPKTHDEVLALYRAATLFVLPCVVCRNGDRDGIPNVLIEAMAMEVSVVSTAVSGIPELVVQRETGLLVPERDVAALAMAMGGLLDLPGLRREIGRRARERVLALFDGSRNVADLARLFLDRASGPVGRAAGADRPAAAAESALAGTAQGPGPGLGSLRDA
jgi:glycosyltransferase involved in cell wall biosynthesis